MQHLGRGARTEPGVAGFLSGAPCLLAPGAWVCTLIMWALSPELCLSPQPPGFLPRAQCSASSASPGWWYPGSIRGSLFCQPWHHQGTSQARD